MGSTVSRACVGLAEIIQKLQHSALVHSVNVVIASIGVDFLFRAYRSLGAKQEGLTIVHFLNKLIVLCKEAVQFPF
jgi:energy-converting hydrogenase Eha subunit E